MFQSGQNRKRVASTTLNAGSSRSHSIFNIRVVQLEQATTNSNGTATIPADNLIKVGQLSLVDLAGSERTNRLVLSYSSATLLLVSTLFFLQYK